MRKRGSFMNEYGKLINVLKQVKENLIKKQGFIYTEEDIKFLKDAYENKELTILDLTYDEVFLLGVSPEQYRRAQRVIYFDKEYSNEYVKELNEKNFNQEPTPRVILETYLEAKCKKICYNSGHIGGIL